MPTDYPQYNTGATGLEKGADGEMALLEIQDRLLTELIGGLFPERRQNFGGFTRVLDITTGSGDWAVNVAQENPQIEVTSLSSQQKIRTRTMVQAEARGTENIQALLLSEKKLPLPFHENTFDLVNAHLLYPLLLSAEWPVFIADCLRITRPGGYLRLTESEWGVTNSPALEKLSSLFVQTLKKAGLGLSPDGRHIGVVPMLSYLLEQAGWSEVTRRTYLSDSFMGPQIASDPALRLDLVLHFFAPLISKYKVASHKAIEELSRSAIIELGSESFCGSELFLTVYGHKIKPTCTSS